MPIPSYILPSAPAYTEDSVYALIPTPSTPIYTPDAISFTRGSDATRTASNGLIQRVPWNLLQQSETFENAYWTKSNASITSNSILAPNGTLTADKIVESTSNSSHNILSTSTTVITGNNYVSSIYAKAGERNWILVIYFDGSVVKGRYFDLTNGVGGSYWLGLTITNSITSVGDGWWRITLSYPATTASNIFGVYLANGDNANSYTGNGTNGAYVWGAQLVEGSTAQTYFPTTDRLNVPRIDFSQGSCPALLLEPQRTNLALYSDQFDSATWTKNASATITANSTTAPDGNTTADTLSVAASTFSGIYRAISGASANYTVSIYAKKDTKNWLYIVDIQGSAARAWFNLDSGVLGTVASGYTATITSVGNGWYRCTLTNTTATSASYYQFGLSDSDNSTTPTSSGSAFIYGAQIEVGSYATTYIPTTSTSVTRLADTATRTGISSLIGQSEGTIFIQFSGKPSNGNSRALTITGGGQEFLIFYEQTATGNLGIVGTNTGLVYIDTGGANDKLYKIAYAYSSNNYALYVNGVSKTITQSPNVYSTLSRIDLNQKENGTEIGLTKIHQVALFQTRLTNTQLASLTTL